MTIYETIKVAISVKQAAEHYGLKVNRNGMACCPFHNDRHPSLKLNEDYFFCFGCGAKGDVIDLVARLFNLSNYEAAQKLASDFGLDPKPPTAAALPKPKHPCIYARFYLGMTVAEIARIEGADRRRVWESIRRGLKKLARLLDTAQ